MRPNAPVADMTIEPDAQDGPAEEIGQRARAAAGWQFPSKGLNTGLQMAAAIQGLIDDPEQARRLGENARQTAFERFSAEAMAEAYMELYDTILQEKGVETEARSEGPGETRGISCE